MISSDIMLLVLRLVVGLLFFGHGTQKLFGWWGGHGIEGTGQFFEEGIEVAPGKFWAIVAGLGETLGGLGLAFGLFTPIAGALIISVMLLAIIQVHWEHGLWNANNGFEYPLVNVTVATVVALAGAGIYSLDNAFGITYPMPATFIIALILGVLGVVAALVSGPTVGEAQEMRSAER